MTATLLHRTARSACVALLLLVGAAPSADALDAYWQGRRDRDWHHGIVGGVSNWYSKAPLQGVAREVPDGGAVFARDAQEHTIRILTRKAISSMLFLSDTERYTFHIQTEFQITGTGIFNQSPAPPHFFVEYGRLVFKNSAGLNSGGLAVGKRSASIKVYRGAELIFDHNSRGGNAEVANDAGLIDRHFLPNRSMWTAYSSFIADGTSP